MKIPFNRPYLAGTEFEYVRKAIESRNHCGNYSFSRECNKLIESKFDILKSFLTPSGTAALEMATVVADIQPGDEVIMPSYTFSSTGNAYCLRGAKPVFAEIEEDTFVLDWKNLERHITKKTKAIVPVTYGGISSDLDKILDIAKAHNLLVMEDAAQGIDAKYKGKYIGSICPISAFSFHETKNISCGEGGALLVNDSKFIEIGEFAQEKGTDRSHVIAGLKNKYTWVALGSSYLLSDMLSAFLLSQLEAKDDIFAKRKKIHDAYTEVCMPFVNSGKIKIQKIPDYCETNYHGFYIVLNSLEQKIKFLEEMKKNGISAYIGYLPLHSSKMGISLGCDPKSLPITNRIADCIVRMPFYNDLTSLELEFIQSALSKVIREL